MKADIRERAPSTGVVAKAHLSCSVSIRSKAECHSAAQGETVTLRHVLGGSVPVQLRCRLGVVSLRAERLCQLARSLRDLQNIVHELREKGVHLKATEQPIDTSSAAGKAFLSMLGVFAEFENNSRRERQLEGINAAKARGVYKGRKPTIKPEEVRRLRKEGLGATEIARKLGVGRASVYRVLQG